MGGGAGGGAQESLGLGTSSAPHPGLLGASGVVAVSWEPLRRAALTWSQREEQERETPGLGIPVCERGPCALLKEGSEA